MEILLLLFLSESCAFFIVFQASGEGECSSLLTPVPELDHPCTAELDATVGWLTVGVHIIMDGLG